MDKLQVDQPYQSFTSFLKDGVDRGGFETDDVLAAVLPLMREVLDRHEQGLVAPLAGIQQLKVSHHTIWFHVADALPIKKDSELISNFTLKNISESVIVVNREDLTHNLDEATKSSVNLRVWDEDELPKVVVYVTGYRSWEHLAGYHDELTDIFSLGLIMASLASGLDFNQVDELVKFADHRSSLHHYCSRLHPVVATMIVKMTELYRENRIQDLRSVIATLENYRDQTSLAEDNLLEIEEGKAESKVSRRHLINSRLRDRLFDLSKRNRLIHFRSTLQTVNLTVSSVPLVLHYKTIRPEQLLTWQPKIAEALANEAPIPLDRYLRYEEAPYLPKALDSIRRQANKDIKEYGFSELRLVLVFFRWYNIKEENSARINSPLLLHPVELVKKKGVRDSWKLQPSGSIAEVNPALKYQLKQIYNLDLPDSIDLSETKLEDFYDNLKKMITASEPAVELKLIDKPQINLAVEKAKKRLDRFLKRRRSSRARKTYANINYSYKRDAYEPLGVQLFLKKVQTSELPLEYLISEKPSLRSPGITSNDTSPKPEEKKKEEVKTRHTYHLRQGSDYNPYVWDFDQCSLTLANFNYRKMSLVRDYNTLLQEDRANEVFDEIFSLSPKAILDKDQPEVPIKDQYLIVPADLTQISAIASARHGKNMIIQGPPGTGKSQTITNLIADYAARGKRVLFVCEKRAALDVVHQRLTASGLDALSCLIHDSQTDKKSFIMDLKDTYEQFISGRVNRKIEKEAKLLAEETEQELSILKNFGEVMSSQVGDMNLRDVMDRLIHLKPHATELTCVEEELFPDYAVWQQHGTTVQQILRTLSTVRSLPDTLAETSFARLNPAVFYKENPLSNLRTAIDQTLPALQEIDEEIKAYSFDTSGCSIQELVALSFICDSGQKLADQNLLSLINEDSKEYAELQQFQKRKALQNSILNKAKDKTEHWVQKLDSRETDSAILQAQKYEGSIMRIFSPGFYKLKKILKQNYAFSKHTIAPTWVTILTDLKEEHQEQAKLDDLYEQTRATLGVQDLDSLFHHIEAFHARKEATTMDKADEDLFYTSLLKNDKSARSTVVNLANLQKPLEDLSRKIDGVFNKGDQMELTLLVQALKHLDSELSYLPELLIDIQDLQDTPGSVMAALQTYPFDVESFEYTCAQKTLNQAYLKQRGVDTFEGWMLRRHAQNASNSYEQWMKKNGVRIFNKVKSELKEIYTLAEKNNSQLNKQEQKRKNSFNNGRRVLEHEFGKTMRYKSIRDLSSGDSGQVILSFKPIWLMSPLSISDTLPLEDDQFDVVIFDEASQVRLEEAIPAIQRAKQLIVVGDEMQLPPTTFFDTSDSSEEEFLLYGEDGDAIEYDLGADSFLTHTGKTLPSLMLGWHYRSRYEALIRFSNTMFYGGNLLTIPDREIDTKEREPLVIQGNEAFPDLSADVLSRSISFHYMENGVYEKRQNNVEALYIAQTVRNLFEQDSGKDIGIVAFSEAQQQKIEEALHQLGKDDDTFRARLELETERHEDGQFCGLFVKNLENVQGDERDIMILSICYAPDKLGKMRMNFGPINRSGGEKRLNVIFSRAKHHMMIVSSIKHHQITNDYNEGANSLKKFLEYAEYTSLGNVEMSAHALSQDDSEADSRLKRDYCEEQLAHALEQRGYLIERNFGQSQFTCDLVIRKQGDTKHKLAILLDGEEHYAIQSATERYLLRPNILKAFGWLVLEVLTKDWLYQPEQVLQTIDHVYNTEVDSVEKEPTESDSSVQTS